MWEHLRAPDILWKHCGPKIRRSRDSILSSEANHVIRRRRLVLYVTEDEEMNCLLRCSCWTFEEHMSVVSIHIWCLSICLMFMCILYCHLNCMTWTGRPFVRLCNLWSFSGNQICTSLPLKNHSCPVIKFTGKQTALAFYIFSPEFL